MGKRLFTSDLHLGHSKVSELRGYASTDDHDAAIIDAWRRTVSKDDIVYVLGDISVGKVTYALDTIAGLPGSKRLIAGNHDYCHPLFRGAEKKQSTYLRVFDSIQLHGRIDLFGKQLLLSHLPYAPQERDPDREIRYDQWRPRDVGARLLCGHVHEAWHTNGRQFNVGVDHHLAPWSEYELEDWITTPLPVDPA